ncbi:MAG: hypothetical protein WC609_00005 [Candidatus Paceibacterota bacterium]|jgi:hypothetical protein
MKNKILVIGVLAIISMFAFNAYAAEKGGSTSGPGVGLEKPEVELEDQEVGEDTQNMQPQDDNEKSVEVQNENKIQNQGEDDQVQNEEQQGKEDGQESESDVATQRRSVVANAVQEMLQIADRNGGIGEQVKTIAQAQNQNQEKIEVSLAKAQDKSGFAKFFFGPNYGEILNAEKLLEQNREQIKQLNEIKNQLINKGDEQALAVQIKTLEQANLEIENSLVKEKSGFSLFGWLFN